MGWVGVERGRQGQGHVGLGWVEVQLVWGEQVGVVDGSVCGKWY